MKKFSRFLLVTLLVTMFAACGGNDNPRPNGGNGGNGGGGAEYLVTISSADEEMGSVSTTGGEYGEGETFTVTATAEDGYIFTGWTSTGDVTLSGEMDNPVTVTVNGAGTVTATFRVPPPPAHILYWNGSTMQVGQWGTVTQNNILFTQFGSAVAFTATSNGDTWDAGDVKFNPTGASYADYTAIPNWNGSSTEDGYISSAKYHTLENVKAGRGDICKLAGLTKANIDTGVYDNGKFRLPTHAENIAAGYDTFVGTPGTVGYGVQVGENTNTFLPAAGYRSISGATNPVYYNGFYWSSRPDNAPYGYILCFSTSVNPSYINGAQHGFAVRCTPQ
jgi:hypothetical protein